MNKLASLLLAAVLLTACSKKEADPQPAPAPAVRADITRTFTYPGNSGFDTALTYTQKTLQIRGQLDATKLLLFFDAPEGSDNLAFTIPAVALAAGLPGTYALRDRQNSPGKVVETDYTYKIVNTPSVSSFHLYASARNNMTGRVIITAYDAQRRLLNGSFEMTMDGVSDPREDFPSPMPMPCNVKVTGSFENLKLE